jgi:hypothetical protein
MKKYPITFIVGLVMVILIMWLAILSHAYLSQETGIFHYIGQDRNGVRKTISYEEMLNIRYVGDLIILLVFYAIWMILMNRLILLLSNTMGEWEAKYWKKRKARRKKPKTFEDYHNYTYDED